MISLICKTDKGERIKHIDNTVNQEKVKGDLKAECIWTYTASHPQLQFAACNNCLYITETNPAKQGTLFRMNVAITWFFFKSPWQLLYPSVYEFANRFETM